MKFFSNIRARLRSFKTVCLDALTAIRDLAAVGRELTAAINRYYERMCEPHEDTKKM